jgi:diadenosine tetraphosphatase ApaH/serine/threonine PP2A family protein phosphatase
VLGNTDEMLCRPESLAAFAAKSPGLSNLFSAIEEMAAATRAMLGPDRLAWLCSLPLVQLDDSFALVHGRPDDPWSAPGAGATDSELKSVYESLGRGVAIYAHIHQPYIRELGGFTIVNCGSVGLPYDGDARASYLLLNDARPVIRRVPYDIEMEVHRRAASGLPHQEWIASMLRTARPQMP